MPTVNAQSISSAFKTSYIQNADLIKEASKTLTEFSAVLTLAAKELKSLNASIAPMKEGLAEVNASLNSGLLKLSTELVSALSKLGAGLTLELIKLRAELTGGLSELGEGITKELSKLREDLTGVKSKLEAVLLNVMGNLITDRLTRKSGFASPGGFSAPRPGKGKGRVAGLLAAAGLLFFSTDEFSGTLGMLVESLLYTGNLLSVARVAFVGLSAGLKLLLGFLLANPIGAAIAGAALLAALLFAYSDEILAITQKVRDTMDGWARSIKKTIGQDPDGPMGSDLVEVEHGGRKIQMARGAVLKSGLMTPGQVAQLPKVTPGPADQSMAPPAGAVVSQPVRAADAVSPAVAASAAAAVAGCIVNNYGDTVYNIKSDDPKGVRFEIEESQRIACTATRGGK